MPPCRLSRAHDIVVLLIVVGLAAGCKKDTKKNPPPDSNPPVNTPSGGAGGGSGAGAGAGAGETIPAGWSEGRDTMAGYRVLLPGGNPQFQTTPAYIQEKNVGAAVLTHSFRNPDTSPRVRGISFEAPAGFKLDTSADNLFAALKLYNRVIDSHHVLLEKTPAKLDGKPALKVVLKPKFLGSERLPDDPVFRKDEIERREKEDAKRKTYYVTTTSSRIVVLEIETPTDPDPALVKTVAGSFKFL